MCVQVSTRTGKTLQMDGNSRKSDRGCRIGADGETECGRNVILLPINTINDCCRENIDRIAFLPQVQFRSDA